MKHNKTNMTKFLAILLLPVMMTIAPYSVEATNTLTEDEKTSFLRSLTNIKDRFRVYVGTADEKCLHWKEKRMIWDSQKNRYESCFIVELVKETSRFESLVSSGNEWIDQLKKYINESNFFDETKKAE